MASLTRASCLVRATCRHVVPTCRAQASRDDDGPKRTKSSNSSKKRSSSAGKKRVDRQKDSGDVTLANLKKENVDSSDLKKLHEELMKQIGERKKAQAELSRVLMKGREDQRDDGTLPGELLTHEQDKGQPEIVQEQPQAQIEPLASPPSHHDESDNKEEKQDVLNIVMVASECAPWSKTGGLGDVVGALPKFLAQRGHRVMVVVPRYKCYDDAWETGVRHRLRVMGQEHEFGYFHASIDGVDFVFVDHPAYLSFGDDIYGGNRDDIQFRCALLCKAALEAPWKVPCGGSVYGDDSLVFIANDWHTALLPVYLKAHYQDHGQMGYARSVFVIHNIAHQGRAPMDELGPFEIPDSYTELFRLYDPIGGEHMNVMKAGLSTCQRIVAVSNGYAWECQTQEGGWGLDGVIRENNWKLRGVVNGIDTNDWNPSVDVHLESDGYQKYDLSSYKTGKAACKAALQRELGLPENPDVPLLGFIGRLDYQKGVDLICDNYEWLMSQGVQLVLLGSGRDDLEGMLRDMEQRNNDKCRAWVGFSVRTAHRITAGADLLLMPSRFEPCGLNQLYAMAYGTVPVVHAVGGLRDTVQPFNPYDNSGTGWTFEWADSSAFQRAIGDALYTYRDHRESFHGLQVRGMEQDLSWQHAAELYEGILKEAKYQW